MNAVQERTAKLPPRLIVRTAWVLHRALYRLTRGRIGLRRPMVGDTFGMLRLTTVGRRSGQPRIAIVGYLEDGENLVTLAMNGWGTSEPAWWLNLQSNPDAVVGLTNGSRAIRARASCRAGARTALGQGQRPPGVGQRRRRPRRRSTDRDTNRCIRASAGGSCRDIDGDFGMTDLAELLATGTAAAPR